jgi:hypothetical protein
MNNVFVLLKGAYEQDIISIFISYDDAAIVAEKYLHGDSASTYNTLLYIQEWEIGGRQPINNWQKDRNDSEWYKF